MHVYVHVLCDFKTTVHVRSYVHVALSHAVISYHIKSSSRTLANPVGRQRPSLKMLPVSALESGETKNVVIKVLDTEGKLGGRERERESERERGRGGARESFKFSVEKE